jgi:hypothetical protein
VLVHGIQPCPELRHSDRVDDAIKREVSHEQHHIVDALDSLRVAGALELFDGDKSARHSIDMSARATRSTQWRASMPCTSGVGLPRRDGIRKREE